MKKITSIAAALFMATAFCGVCSGCASEINAKSESKNDTAPTAAVATSADYKVILCPGNYYSGNTAQPNTVSGDGITKLQAADEDAYFVNNAYFANMTAGSALPVATTTRANTTFEGWTYAEGGVVKTVTHMPASLSDNLYLYASWKSNGSGSPNPNPNPNPNPDPNPTPDPNPDPDTKADGVYVNNTLVGSLVKNDGATGKTQYWLGVDTKIQLNLNAEVELWIDNAKVSATLLDYSIGVDKSVTDRALSKFKVTTAGRFAIYLNKESNNSWTVEFAGPTDIGGTTTVPQGTLITLTGADSKWIKIYLKDSSGRDITDFTNIKMWAWNPGNILAADWNNRPAVTATMQTMSGANLGATVDFKFTYGSGSNTQTRNFTGVSTGRTYVVTLNGDNSTIQELTA